jgi:two-component system nitrate/nitrite response regulator NarL
MFREGLARMLERESDLKIVGQVASSGEALDALNAHTDVVLLDVDLGAERALGFIELARKAQFEGKILILTAGISGQEAIQLVQAGVEGIVHKHHPTRVLCDLIRQVAAGKACIEPEYLSPLFQSVDKTRKEARSRLTERDRTILGLILEGLTNREIGDRIGISEGAVKASLRQLFDKLGVHTRAQLVKVALDQYREQL